MDQIKIDESKSSKPATDPFDDEESSQSKVCLTDTVVTEDSRISLLYSKQRILEVRNGKRKAYAHLYPTMHLCAR